jgi:hypothetical protein
VPEEEEDEKLIEDIETDIDMAEEILDLLIPQALFYYMNLMIVGDDYSEEDSDDNGKKAPGKKGKSSERKGSKTETKKECKQQ